MLAARCWLGRLGAGGGAPGGGRAVGLWAGLGGAGSWSDLGGPGRPNSSRSTPLRAVLPAVCCCGVSGGRHERARRSWRPVHRERGASCGALVAREAAFRSLSAVVLVAGLGGFWCLGWLWPPGWLFRCVLRGCCSGVLRLGRRLLGDDLVVGRCFWLHGSRTGEVSWDLCVLVAFVRWGLMRLTPPFPVSVGL